MKRNETVLVYGVTAVLVVVLAVAVIWGDGGSGATDPGKSTNAGIDLEDILGVKPKVPEKLAEPPAAKTGGETAAAGAPKPAEPAASQPAAPLPGAGVPLDIAQVNRSLGVAILGESRRDGNFRIVKVKPGDSLGKLVERWCGNTRQDTMATVYAVNEALQGDRVKPGQEVVVPWVEDAVVLASYEARQKAGEPAAGPPVAGPAASPGPKTPAPASATVGQDYVVQPRDSLWSIANRHVGAQGQGAVAAYVKRIVAANPGLVADQLKPKQTIKLP
jgi:LysM repeat protein